MNPFKLPFAIAPNTVTQQWGTLDPYDYSQFGYTRHNGKDLAIAPDATVRAPRAGTIIRTGDQPSGGGIFCGLLLDGDFDFPDFYCKTPAMSKAGVADGITIRFPAANCKVLIDFLHLKSLSIEEGQAVQEGDVLGIQDNTGFSTGPHTHEQFRREKLIPIEPGQNVSPGYRVMGNNFLQDIDKNDANNSFDPTQFEDGTYAAVKPIADAAEKVAQDIVASPDITPQEKVDWLTKLLNGLLSFFKPKK